MIRKRLPHIDVHWRSTAPDEYGSRVVTASTPAVALSLVALHGLALLALLASPWLPAVVHVPPVVLALSFVPGGLLTLMAVERIRVDARWILYALGLSLATVIVTGVVANLVLPAVGVGRPMDPAPLAVTTTLTVVGLAAAAVRTRPDGRVTFTLPALLSPFPLALLLLPLGSVLAVTAVNRFGTNVPVIVVLGLIAVVPAALVLRGAEGRWYSLGIWATALAILYHKSLWEFSTFNGSAGVIRSWEASRWTPGVFEMGPTSTSLIENGVLFPTYARFSAVDIMTELEVINPFLVSFIPLALFVAFRHYVGQREAFLGAALFAFAHPFYLQYPTAGRAATPVLFLALLGIVLADADVRPSLSASLGLVFVSGVITTHYGSAYFVMFGVLGTAFLLTALAQADRVLTFARSRVGRSSPSTDGGRSLPSPGFRGRRDIDAGSRVFTWGFATFTVVGTVAWYLFTNVGEEFQQLPRLIYKSLLEVFANQDAAGRAPRSAARLQRNYVDPAISMSKSLYILIGALIAVGLAYAYYRRFARSQDPMFDDHYLAVATLMLSVFGLTFVAPGWGGGRPLMITYVFTAVFAVVGARAIVTLVTSLLGRVPLFPRTDGRAPTLGLFAVLLAVFFVLNSGVASSVVLDGGAPSNVPLHEELQANNDFRLYTQTDVATHGWLISNVGRIDVDVVGDKLAKTQADWYNPGIELASVGYGTYQYGSIGKAEGIGELSDPGEKQQYVVLLGHNVVGGEVRLEDDTVVPLSSFSEELSQRNRIYTTGVSSIYYHGGDRSD